MCTNGFPVHCEPFYPSYFSGWPVAGNISFLDSSAYIGFPIHYFFLSFPGGVYGSLAVDLLVLSAISYLVISVLVKIKKENK